MMVCGVCGSNQVKTFEPVQHHFCMKCKAHHWYSRWISKAEWEEIINKEIRP